MFIRKWHVSCNANRYRIYEREFYDELKGKPSVQNEKFFYQVKRYNKQFSHIGTIKYMGNGYLDFAKSSSFLTKSFTGKCLKLIFRKIEEITFFAFFEVRNIDKSGLVVPSIELFRSTCIYWRKEKIIFLGWFELMISGLRVRCVSYHAIGSSNECDSKSI